LYLWFTLVNGLSVDQTRFAHVRAILKSGLIYRYLSNPVFS
jgi:hypothetical protein